MTSLCIIFYCSSSLIVKILKDAFDAGKKFQVIVVDSRPKSEGDQKLLSYQIVLII